MLSIHIYTVHCTVSTLREGYHICIVYNHEAIRSPSPPLLYICNVSLYSPCLLSSILTVFLFCCEKKYQRKSDAGCLLMSTQLFVYDKSLLYRRRWVQTIDTRTFLVKYLLYCNYPDISIIYLTVREIIQ